jgi:protein ImuB
MMRSVVSRRIAAVALPQLGVELVRQRLQVDGPLAVLFSYSLSDSHIEERQTRDKATAIIDLVDETAWHYGVRPGQGVVEAQATLAGLQIHTVSIDEILAALGRIAEVCLNLGATASIRLHPEQSGETERIKRQTVHDTVWLDITGAAHLVGGEQALLDELCERVQALGHRAQAAIAAGPRIAQALARFVLNPSLMTNSALVVQRRPFTTVIAGGTPSVLATLPISVLPLDPDTTGFFLRLGIFNVGALGKLPRAELAPRLGLRAPEVLDLAAGYDPLPLVPYEAPRVLVDQTNFDDPITSVEPLLFVLRSMTSRLASRLEARGEACQAIELQLPLDKSIVRLRKPPGIDQEEPVLLLDIDMPAPLSNAADLHRALRTKLEKTALVAPAVGMRLEVSQIVEAHRIQIDLSRDKAVRPDALPTLLAELSADIGADRVGVLEASAAFRPEARSRFVPMANLEAKKSALPSLDDIDQDNVPEPTRLFATPVPLGRITKGAVVAVEGRMYVIEHVRFAMRLDGVEWWTSNPASRDYGVAWFVAGPGTARADSGKAAAQPVRTLAWVYVDRASGEGYLQGYCE